MYLEGMSLEDGEKLALQCLKQVMEDKIKKTRVDLVVINTSEKTFTKRSDDYKENILSQIPDNLN